MICSYALRERFFRLACPVRELDQKKTIQSVYHGSPLEGMVSMMRAGKLIPQGQAELPDSDWLSVSVNDNVLKMFSEEDSLTGFSAMPKLRVAHLDSFHFDVAVADNCPSDWISNFEENETFHKWAFRLNYYNERRGVEMHAADLRRLLRDNECHGLSFPNLNWDTWHGFHCHNWNDEAEIALNDEGCDETWRRLDMIFVRGEEYTDLNEGWRAIAHAAVKDSLLDKKEARQLIKKMDGIIAENSNYTNQP